MSIQYLRWHISALSLHWRKGRLTNCLRSICSIRIPPHRLLICSRQHRSRRNSRRGYSTAIPPYNLVYLVLSQNTFRKDTQKRQRRNELDHCAYDSSCFEIAESQKIKWTGNAKETREHVWANASQYSRLCMTPQIVLQGWSTDLGWRFDA